MSAQEFKVDKGLPIPPQRTALRYTGLSEAIRQMEVGDSIALPFVTKSNPNCNIRDAAKKVGIRITIRKVGDSVRFWRVA